MTSPTSGRRLILIEDNDSVRMATELFLSLEGFDTRSAATIAEAETLLADIGPGDILITDFHLDGILTGLDMLTQVRIQQGRDVPAILLSGDLQSMMRADQDLDSAMPFPEQAGRHQIFARGHIRTQRRLTHCGRQRRRVRRFMDDVFHHPPPSAVNNATVSWYRTAIACNSAIFACRH